MCIVNKVVNTGKICECHIVFYPAEGIWIRNDGMYAELGFKDSQCYVVAELWPENNGEEELGIEHCSV